MSKYCIYCGSPLDEKPVCPQCGKPVQDSSYHYNDSSVLEPPMTLGDWIITMLLTAIPIVNIILMIYWAISAKNTSKKNYARAFIIFTLVVIVLSVLLSGCTALMIRSMA